MRILAIRFTAVCFILLGLWEVILFFQEMYSNNAPNWAHVVIGIILVRTGDNLFSFHEIGRKLALVVLGLHILQLLAISFLGIALDNFQFTLGVPGVSFVSENKILFVAVFISWLAVDFLISLLLLQKKTRLIFQSKHLG